VHAGAALALHPRPAAAVDEHPTAIVVRTAIEVAARIARHAAVGAYAVLAAGRPTSAIRIGAADSGRSTPLALALPARRTACHDENDENPTHNVTRSRFHLRNLRSTVRPPTSRNVGRGLYHASVSRQRRAAEGHRIILCFARVRSASTSRSWSEY